MDVNPSLIEEISDAQVGGVVSLPPNSPTNARRMREDWRQRIRPRAAFVPQEVSMAFCTIVEWDRDISEALSRMPGYGSLPAGSLVHIYGAAESGTCEIEVWESGEDARRFAEESAPALAQSSLPPPTRVVGFQTSSVVIRQGT